MKSTLDNKDRVPELDAQVNELVEEIYCPAHTFLQHKNSSTAIDSSANYITPKMLDVAENKREIRKKDALNMRAKDLHECPAPENTTIACWRARPI